MALTADEKRARKKAYYIAHREAIIARACAQAREKAPAIKAYKQSWQARNALRIAAKKKQHYENYRDIISAKAKDAYKASPERFKANALAYRKANPDKVKAATAAWAVANRGRIAATKRAYRATRLEQLNAVSRSYYAAHKLALAPQRSASGKAWRKANPEKNAEKEARRRAQKRRTQVERVNYKQVLIDSHGLCGICRKPLDLLGTEFDHIVPLARGGTHTQDNIQAAHAYCNRSKGARVA